MKGEIWQKRGREGEEGERGEDGGKGRRGKGRGGKGRAPMTLWHGAPNVLIRPWARALLPLVSLWPTVVSGAPSENHFETVNASGREKIMSRYFTYKYCRVISRQYK